MSNVVEYSIRSLDEFSATMAKLDASMNNMQDQFAKSTQATKKLNDSQSMLSGIAKKVAGAFSLYRIADFAKDAIMASARFETMGVVMEVAGRNTGYSREEMDRYAASLQKSGISMTQSRNALTQLATAHIDLSKASEIGRAAQNLAVVGNLNSSDAMARMIHGIKSGEIEILRTMGLNVNFEDSYKRLALQLGINTTQLSNQQEMMARTNIVLEGASAYAGIYEKSMTTAGKAVLSLDRHIENFKVNMGEAFQPLFAEAVFGLTDALKFLNEHAKEVSAAVVGITVAGTAFIGMRIAAAAYTAAAAFVTMEGGIVAATVAVRAFLLTNPIGWITLALGVGAAAWYEWGDNAKVASTKAKTAASSAADMVNRWSVIFAERKAEEQRVAEAAAAAKAKAEKKVQDDINATIAAMQKSVITYGMTSDQVKIYELAVGGASAKQVEAALAAANQRSELDAIVESLKAATESSEAFATAQENQVNAALANSVGMYNSLDTELDKHNQRLQEIQASRELLMEGGRYEAALENEQKLWENAQASVEYYGVSVRSVSQGIADAFASTIAEGASLSKGLENMARGVLKTVISTLIQIGVQRMILAALDTTATAAISSQKIAAGMGEVYVNSFASAAAIPVIGWAMAPGVAATNTALAMAGAGASMASGAALGGAAHGGLGYVPSETTYLLQRGERVVSPRQNEDLTNFLNQGSGGGLSVQHLEIHVLENATNIDAFARMDSVQLRNALGQPVVDALNEMLKIGVRPNYTY